MTLTARNAQETKALLSGFSAALQTRLEQQQAAAATALTEQIAQLGELYRLRAKVDGLQGAVVAEVRFSQPCNCCFGLTQAGHSSWLL